MDTINKYKRLNIFKVSVNNIDMCISLFEDEIAIT